MIPPEVLRILACPCPRHEALEVTEDQQKLACKACATTFPIDNGIPVLLLSEATPGPGGIGQAKE